MYPAPKGSSRASDLGKYHFAEVRPLSNRKGLEIRLVRVFCFGIPLPALTSNLPTIGNFRVSQIFSTPTPRLHRQLFIIARAERLSYRHDIMLSLLVSFRLWPGPYCLVVIQPLRGYLYAFCMVSASCTRSELARVRCTSIYGKAWRFGGFGGLEIGPPDSARFVTVGCFRAAALERGVCIRVQCDLGSPVSSIMNILDEFLSVIDPECELSFLLSSPSPAPFPSSSLPPSSSSPPAVPAFFDMIRRA